MSDDDYEECDYSGLAKIFCAHCRGDKLGDEKPEIQKYGNLDVERDGSEDPEDVFEIVGRAFEAKYKGRCTINYDHVIKMGSRVAKVQRQDNPMIPVAGVACEKCIRLLPKARL